MSCEAYTTLRRSYVAFGPKPTPLLASPAPFAIQRPNAFHRPKPAIPVHFSVRIACTCPTRYATPRHAPRPRFGPKPHLCLSCQPPLQYRGPNAFHEPKTCDPGAFLGRIGLHALRGLCHAQARSQAPFWPKTHLCLPCQPPLHTEAKRVPRGKTCDPGAFLSPNRLAHALRGLCHAQARSQAPFWPKTHLCLPCQPPLQYRGQTRFARQNLRSRCISQSE